MSFFGRKGTNGKSISSVLKKLGNTKIIEERCGIKQFEAIIDNMFVSVLNRYSEERGVNFCLDHDILELARGGRTSREILFEKEWKYQAMLEDLLDFLVWRGFLKKTGREYYSLVQPKQQKSVPGEKDESTFEPNIDLTAQPKGVATLRDISPFASRRNLPIRALEQFGLQPKDRKWLEETKGYKAVFDLFDRISSRFILESMELGIPTLDAQPAQFGPLMDNFFLNPSFIVPRMAVMAAVFKQAMPTKILDLNCGTGRCVEELLLFNPNAEIIGVTDNRFYLQVAERNLEIFSEQRQLYPHIEWRVIDYAQPLSSQLEDLVGQCDMILVNQLFQYFPPDMHQLLVEEILSFVKTDGVVTLFQHLRPDMELPWPHEWFYRTLQGFFGIPDERTFKELLRKEKGKNIREIIPLSSYLIF